MSVNTGIESVWVVQECYLVGSDRCERYVLAVLAVYGRSKPVYGDQYLVIIGHPSVSRSI